MAMQRKEGGETGVDNDFVSASMSGKGAWILGRNMFGPIRGPWPDYNWKGWWGDAPPYHVPTFVLTHYARDPVEMKGGTTFYFVTDGIESALEQAKAAAGDLDIRIGGGSETIRQYLRAGLLDELHLAQRPGQELGDQRRQGNRHQHGSGDGDHRAGHHRPVRGVGRGRRVRHQHAPG